MPPPAHVTLAHLITRSAPRAQTVPRTFADRAQNAAKTCKSTPNHVKTRADRANRAHFSDRCERIPPPRHRLRAQTCPPGHHACHVREQLRLSPPATPPPPPRSRTPAPSGPVAASAECSAAARSPPSTPLPPPPRRGTCLPGIAQGPEWRLGSRRCPSAVRHPHRAGRRILGPPSHCNTPSLRLQQGNVGRRAPHDPVMSSAV